MSLRDVLKLKVSQPLDIMSKWCDSVVESAEMIDKMIREYSDSDLVPYRLSEVLEQTGSRVGDATGYSIIMDAGKLQSSLSTLFHGIAVAQQLMSDLRLGRYGEIMRVQSLAESLYKATEVDILSCDEMVENIKAMNQRELETKVVLSEFKAKYDLLNICYAQARSQVLWLSSQLDYLQMLSGKLKLQVQLTRESAYAGDMDNMSMVNDVVENGI